MKRTYTKLFLKNYKKLDKPTRKRILKSIDSLPEGDIRKLKGYSDKYRLRIGNYRVLFTLKSDIIQIDDILPRGQAYKR